MEVSSQPAKLVGGGASVVVRDRESLLHGEGMQQTVVFEAQVIDEVRSEYS